MVYDFEFTQGAVGDAERFEWRLAAPAGIDFLAFASRVLTMQVRAPSGAVFPIGPWALISSTSALLVFRFTPAGTEFPELGEHAFAATLQLDTLVTRYTKVRGKNNSRW
jgi:hypothetical protein